MAIEEKVRNSAFLVFFLLARAIPTPGGHKTQFLGAFQNGAFIGRVMGQSSLGFARKCQDCQEVKILDGAKFRR